MKISFTLGQVLKSLIHGSLLEAFVNVSEIVFSGCMAWAAVFSFWSSLPSMYH